MVLEGVINHPIIYVGKGLENLTETRGLVDLTLANSYNKRYIAKSVEENIRKAFNQMHAMNIRMSSYS